MRWGQDSLASYRSGVNNNRGHEFEGYIKAGCVYYAMHERAKVDKTPEPFRVLEKREKGVFVGRFTAHAQPDFQGTLDGGRSIIFEAKYTTTDKMAWDVLTETQMETLEEHGRRGAMTGVCVGIRENFFFVPWPVWRDMKELWGKKTVTAKDLESFQVKFNGGAVLFLDYVTAPAGKWAAIKKKGRKK